MSIEAGQQGITHNVKRLGDGGFYTQRIFKTAIAKPVLYEVFIFLRWQKHKLKIYKNYGNI